MQNWISVTVFLLNVFVLVFGFVLVYNGVCWICLESTNADPNDFLRTNIFSDQYWTYFATAFGSNGTSNF